MKENYIIKQTDENTWTVLNENEEVVKTITKDIIVNCCKNECEDIDTHYLSMDSVVDSAWWDTYYKYDLDFVDNSCQEYDKFLAWFDYICVEYLAKEIVAFHKQRLLNFE